MIQGDEESSASLSAPPLVDLLPSKIEAPCLVSTGDDEKSNNKEEEEEDSSSKRTERKPQLIDVIVLYVDYLKTHSQAFIQDFAAGRVGQVKGHVSIEIFGNIY